MRLDAEQVFGARGILRKSMEGFEYREEQVRMMRAIEEAIDKDEILLVEAGAGVGKTLAYLVPIIQSGRKAIVATGTKTLMNQIATKDCPMLEKYLPFSFSYAMLKGRSNYLCIKKFEQMLASGDLFGQRWSEDFVRLMEWARKTATGDLSEVGFFSEGNPFLQAVSCDLETCEGRPCHAFGRCFLFKARSEALQKDIIITNHALFFADMAMKEGEQGGLFEEDRILVLDEAHGIENEASEHLGIAVTVSRVRKFVTVARALALATDVTSGRALLEACERVGERFLKLLDCLCGRGMGRSAIVIDDQVERAWFELDAELDLVEDEAVGICENDEVKSDVPQMAKKLRDDIRRVLEGNSEDSVRYVEKNGGQSGLYALPIDVSSVLASALFSKVRPVILVSATLTAQGKTDFIRKRLGVPVEAKEVVLSSPFNFEKQALLYIPTHLEDPNDEGFYEAFASEALKILEATRGRAFLLFTSYAGMQKAFKLMSGALPFKKLVQGEAPRERLLEDFRSSNDACLFATQTFWEGVDVAGSALSCVIIDRLPFDPPDDPVLEARRKRIMEQGGEPFVEYQLPLAIIRLRQGFGRLIRSANDKGVVAIMDSRIVRKGYGKAFLKSLPPAKVTHDISEVVRWCKRHL